MPEHLSILWQFTTVFLLTLASVGAAGWIVARMLEERWRVFARGSKVERLLVGVVFVAMWMFGGGKPAGVRRSAKGEEIVRELAKGVVLTRVGTNEVFDFSAPPNAVVCEEWRRFGAHDDWQCVTVGTNTANRMRVFSSGKVEVFAEDGNFFAPFASSLGIVPEANLDLLSLADRPSVFWHCISPENRLLMTWQNVLLNREVFAPVSFQLELAPNGSFAYRYDFSRVDADALSDIVCGVSLGGDTWLTNSLAVYTIDAKGAVDNARCAA